MTTMTIRKMSRADIPAVAALEADVFDQPWPPRVFFNELAMDNRAYVVVTDGDGLIVGYGGLLVADEDAHITTLAVAPEARGEKLGKRLMISLVDEALRVGGRHLTLEVRLSNSSARGLYERFGFSPVGRRKDYYEDEDALVMWATDIDTDDYASRIHDIRSSIEGGLT